MYGYTGAVQALGPESKSVGELKPWPCAIDRAKRPISQPN
jgi:hypothetical protein